MDKTLRSFWSGQTKDTTTLSQNNSDKDLGQRNVTNRFRDAGGVNAGQPMQNPTIEMKRKDSDSFFYIL